MLKHLTAIRRRFFAAAKSSAKEQRSPVQNDTPAVQFLS